MADKIDTGEAVKCLDIYSDDLVSLSLLVRASTFQDETDEEMCEIYEGLKSAIEEKQKKSDSARTRYRRGHRPPAGRFRFLGRSFRSQRCDTTLRARG
jgi:hypothetical protein